jgi:hypothetical protein
MHCADFPRHLGRQITRCLIAHHQADTMQLADWAYGLDRIRPGIAGISFAVAGIGKPTDRQADDRQGWPAKARLGATEARGGLRLSVFARRQF